MSVAASISRFAEFYRRHGFAATVSRVQVGLKRKFFAGRMVVFYCDLTDRRLSQPSLAELGKVRQLRAVEDLTTEQFRRMTDFWNPKVASKHIDERFAKGASLWMLECDDQFAGYGWTLQGTTVEPYYFPLTDKDVHFFDFHVFPSFRGRGLNPYLVCTILGEVASQNRGRAFIEAAEWNAAQIASLKKTPFRRYGLVRPFRIFGRAFASWAEKEPVPAAQSTLNSTDPPFRMAGSSKP
jgi:ribosomal protein S18 acetylase RimI-like enzyme